MLSLQIKERQKKAWKSRDGDHRGKHCRLQDLILLPVFKAWMSSEIYKNSRKKTPGDGGTVFCQNWTPYHSNSFNSHPQDTKVCRLAPKSQEEIHALTNSQRCHTFISDDSSPSGQSHRVLKSINIFFFCFFGDNDLKWLAVLMAERNRTQCVFGSW